MGVAVLTCEDCGKQTTDMVKTRCRLCYRRHWLANSEAGQRLVRRRAADRKAPPTLRPSRPPRFDGDDGEPNSAAWYSAYNRVPAETQELILRAYLEGHEPAEIATAVEVETNLVKAIIERGAISPRRVEPYRCQHCRNKVITEPCFICWTKRRVRPGQRIHEVDA